MTYTLFHTAPVHQDSFEALRQRLAPDATLTHVVREDWLARAQSGLDDALHAEITDAIRACTGPVLCTCTTLGQTAEKAGAIRIDQPMMQAAAETDASVLMAYCLTSTEKPSHALLQREMTKANNAAPIVPVFLGAHWPLFEAGSYEAFAIAIAADIRAAVAKTPSAGAVVLAQASMAGATDHLELSIPVFSSPALAFGALLNQAPLGT
ncbi:MAG: hypothetical protein JXR13_03985 [Thalassovita sp.]